jgi:PD-(D/E)XK nuclease superfamily
MAYSNSAIKTYEQCPFKYKLTRIDKLVEPTGDAAKRGVEIHTLFEKALVFTKLPQEFTYWQTYISELRSKHAGSEVRFAITKDWQVCGFNDSVAWLRGIYDCLYVEGSKGHVLDWKTGKERDYGDQLKLYAIVMFVTYAELDEISTEVCYIDLQKRSAGPTFKRSQLPELKDWLTNKVGKIENDDIFAPKPDFGCRWCHFRKDNGGPCQW